MAWLQKWAFDLARFRATGEVRYNPDFAPTIATIAAKLDPLATVRFLRYMVKQQRIVSHPLNARLLFEQLLLAYTGVLAGRPWQQAA